jgi:hypothetical protein
VLVLRILDRLVFDVCYNGSGEERITPAEYTFPGHGNPGTGSSGVAGIETVVLKGDLNQAGLYTIMLRVPTHTKIAAHSHGLRYLKFGYGDNSQESNLKILPPGSFYTEPVARTHFLPRPATTRLLSRSPVSVPLQRNVSTRRKIRDVEATPPDFSRPQPGSRDLYFFGAVFREFKVTITHNSTGGTRGSVRLVACFLSVAFPRRPERHDVDATERGRFPLAEKQ